MRHLKGELILFIAALIWGVAFVFQSTAADVLGPLSFGGCRFLLGALSLLPLLKTGQHNFKDKRAIRYGVLLGVVVFIGSTLQQYAIAFTTSGKAGFITSLYMIFVPILGYIFFRYRAKRDIIIALILATIGLYLINGASLSFGASELALLASAIFFAIQIILIDRYVGGLDPLVVSFFQYFICGAISMVLAIIFEGIDIKAIEACLDSILYTGILSTGVAYTLQIIGQRNTDPSVASIILSLEAVISAIGGFLILNETLTVVEMLGCSFMFVAVLLSQRRTKDAKS